MSDQPTPDAATSTDEGPEVFDREYVEKLRKEAARYRTEARAATEQLTSLQQQTATNETPPDWDERLRGAEEHAATADKRNKALTLALQHGLDNDAVEILNGVDTEAMDSAAERLAAFKPPRFPNGNRVPHEGKTPDIYGSNWDTRQYVRDLFNG